MTWKIIKKSILLSYVLTGWAPLHSLCQDDLISQLQFSETAPAEILATRSIVLYDHTLKKSELEEIQKAFQKTGIDAIAYFEGEKAIAGRDPARAYSEYFNLRQIKFLILLRKTPVYEFFATTYNGKSTYVNPQQSAWRVRDANLNELLLKIYRDSWLSQKKQNFLINDSPEMGIAISTILGRRSELYPIDLKTDNLAIPKLNDPVIQEQLENLLAASYPYNNKYKMVEVPENEKDLRKQGYQYILCFVHCRGIAMRELLGYDLRKESAYGSMTYPNSTPQLKTISVETPVYKFYIKHVESGNVFLGTKWDADETLIQSLKNHLYGFRSELKLN